MVACMDRCALFVDAGYVYAEGGRISVGSTARSKFSFDYQSFVTMIQSRATVLVGCPALRVYWYDGARNGVRTAEQLKIAEVPLVKLRLGRLNGKGQQKGVDALIYRDMITLAQNRAVSEMVLVSGDEDLHEGVTAVQDFGVRVTLVGIEPAKGEFNQSRDLVLDADQHFVLSRAELAPLFVKSAPAVPLPGMEAAPEALPAPAPSIKDAAEAFATDWLSNASSVDLTDLLANHPRVPQPLDKELLATVERSVGVSLRGSDTAHREARKAFWAAIQSGTPRPAKP